MSSAKWRPSCVGLNVLRQDDSENDITTIASAAITFRVGWGKGPLWGQTPSADSLEIMWPGESRDSSSETLRKQRLLHERGAR